MQSIPGVGRKIAERIALELPEKAVKLKGQQPLPTPLIPREDERVYDDGVSALVNLGYSPRSAKEAVDRARAVTKDVTLETLIKEALKVLA